MLGKFSTNIKFQLQKIKKSSSTVTSGTTKKAKNVVLNWEKMIPNDASQVSMCILNVYAEYLNENSHLLNRNEINKVSWLIKIKEY